MRLIERWTCIFALGLMAAAPLSAQNRLSPGMSHEPEEVLSMACSPTRPSPCRARTCRAACREHPDCRDGA